MSQGLLCHDNDTAAPFSMSNTHLCMLYRGLIIFLMSVDKSICFAYENYIDP
mgnify:FL=1